uniref:SCD domain-containing protein n=1 Tax=Strigamia maritima TaxID=126957 RepID=T1IZS7_STRMM
MPGARLPRKAKENLTYQPRDSMLTPLAQRSGKRIRSSSDPDFDPSMAVPSDEWGDQVMMQDVMDDAQSSASEDLPARGRGKKRTRGTDGGPSKRAKRVEPKEPSKRGRPGKRIAPEQYTEDPNCLFEVVKQGKSALQTVVDDWIESYKQDRDSALLDLMQFFIQSSGCRGKITPQMQANMEHTQIIRKMTEEFDEESGDYPLIMAGPQWKKFKLNFCEFVQILVKQCQYSIIYDQYLMDNVISLLTGLSDSQVRAFRHTSTLAAMKLMTALVDVALSLSINLDNTQRQYEAERQKTRDKRASERLELLMGKRQELEENMEEIKNMLTYMFKSVFVHRYRDTLPEIRSICMSEIGIWMKKFHQNFLDDSYLKYIGWTLHDKVGDVRLKCLTALQPLYASEELTPKLELFTNKFKDRIVAMTLDKEFDVAVQAVKLVISILKWSTKNDNKDLSSGGYQREILSDKDCEHVYELVYSSHRAVAQAAGEFLNERLFTPNEEAVKGLRSKRGKKLSANTPLVRDLVQFFIESELHEHGAYLVDSLIESNPMMKDWECMTDLLLEEPLPNEEPLDDRQETSLIEIMVCCVKQAATGEPPVGRGPNRKQLSAKEAKQVNDDKVKLTEHFILFLPALLSKYITDPEKIVNLMIIPQYFELEIYTTSRQEQNLEGLLKLIQEIVEKHTEQDVLEACAKTFETLCCEDYTIHSRCDVGRSTLIDQLVNKYKEALDEYRATIDASEVPDEDLVFDLTSSLKKVGIFNHCHNLAHLNVWDSFFDWVKQAQQDPKSIPEEVVKYALSCCSAGIMWDLGRLDENTQNPLEIRALRDKLHSFMAVCRNLLNSISFFQSESFVTVCDLLLIFCNQLHDNMVLKELVYEPDLGLQSQLSVFIQDKVFIDDDDDEQQDEHSKIEELHKRRNFLASFCKLVVYNVMSTKVAADIFKHYVKVICF